MWGQRKMRGKSFGKVRNFSWFSSSSGEEVKRERNVTKI